MNPQFKTITPEMAQNWLEHHNHHNRKLRQSRWKMMANDMRAGRFSCTHQGIAFAYDGTLIDGQHRLKAIVESGVSVTLLIVTGLDYESQMVTDAHAPRSYADALSLAGHGNGELSNRDIAIARCMMSHGSAGGQGVVSKGEVAEFIDSYLHAITFARQCFPKTQIKGLVTAPVVATPAQAYYDVSHDRLREFGEAFSTGMVSGDGDYAAVALRNHCINNPDMSRSVRYRRTLYLKAHGCLKAFVEGRCIRRVSSCSTPIYDIRTSPNNPNADGERGER